MWGLNALKKILIGLQQSSDSPCALRYGGKRRNFKEVAVKQVFWGCLGCELCLFQVPVHPSHGSSWPKSGRAPMLPHNPTLCFLGEEPPIKQLCGKKGTPLTDKWRGWYHSHQGRIEPDLGILPHAQHPPVCHHHKGQEGTPDPILMWPQLNTVPYKSEMSHTLEGFSHSLVAFCH